MEYLISIIFKHLKHKTSLQAKSSLLPVPAADFLKIFPNSRILTKLNNDLYEVEKFEIKGSVKLLYLEVTHTEIKDKLEKILKYTEEDPTYYIVLYYLFKIAILSQWDLKNIQKINHKVQEIFLNQYVLPFDSIFNLILNSTHEFEFRYFLMKYQLASQFVDKFLDNNIDVKRSFLLSCLICDFKLIEIKDFYVCSILNEKDIPPSVQHHANEIGELVSYEPIFDQLVFKMIAQHHGQRSGLISKTDIDSYIHNWSYSLYLICELALNLFLKEDHTSLVGITKRVVQKVNSTFFENEIKQFKELSIILTT